MSQTNRETADDPSIHPTMYSNRYEEMLPSLCSADCADSNGLGISLDKTADGNEYELTAGVTGWSTEKIRESVKSEAFSEEGAQRATKWAEDLLSHCARHRQRVTHHHDS